MSLQERLQPRTTARLDETEFAAEAAPTDAFLHYHHIQLINQNNLCVLRASAVILIVPKTRALPV
jgi:hypothetical protein